MEGQELQKAVEKVIEFIKSYKVREITPEEEKRYRHMERVDAADELKMALHCARSEATQGCYISDEERSHIMDLGKELGANPYKLEGVIGRIDHLALRNWMGEK